MRTYFLLVSLAAAAAACSEQQQPTSPATAVRTEPRSSAAYTDVANAAAPSPQAKPVDQVGFSKAVAIYSDPLYVPAGQLAAGTATCPVGSFAIGGGYNIFLTAGIKVLSSHPDLVGDVPRGWTLTMDNTAGATQGGFRVWAVCVS
jgi:hypothetical protein